MAKTAVALILPVALSICASVGFAQSYTFENLRIDHPYARPTPPGARTGGAYFAIENRGTAPDRLLRVTTPAAASAEIHSMTMDGNVMKIRAMTAVDVPPHTTTELKPGGYHVMLLDLKRPLTAGETVPLALTFEKAGVVEVPARVEPPGAAADRTAAK